MKLISTTLACFLFGLFSSVPLQVDKASSQKVYGGVAGSGKATEFRVEITLKKNPEKMNIEGIVIDDYYYDEFKLIPEKTPQKHYRQSEQKDYLQKADKGDQVLISFAKRWKADQAGNLIPPPPSKVIDVPEKYTGKDLIVCTWKGKKKYIVIPEVTQKETQHMP